MSRALSGLLSPPAARPRPRCPATGVPRSAKWTGSSSQVCDASPDARVPWAAGTKSLAQGARGAAWFQGRALSSRPRVRAPPPRQPDKKGKARGSSHVRRRTDPTAARVPRRSERGAERVCPPAGARTHALDGVVRTKARKRGSPRHGPRGCVPSYCRTLRTPPSQPGASPLLGLTATTALRGKHVSEQEPSPRDPGIRQRVARSARGPEEAARFRFRFRFRLRKR